MSENIKNTAAESAQNAAGAAEGVFLAIRGFGHLMEGVVEKP